MTADNHTQLILQALEEARIQNPDLSNYYEFHGALVQMLRRAREDISATMEMVDGEVLLARLAAGVPVLSFAQLPVEEARFAELVSTVAQLLAHHDPDLAEQTVPDSATECLALARRRFEENRANKERDEATLAQMAVDLALKPYLEWAAERVLPHLEQERWKRGYCPVCGGGPDFAILDEESGARHLLCSRCSSQWDFRRLGCPFCGTTDHTKIVYYPSEDEVYRLYVCQECSRYLKTIDLREVEQEVLLPVERITTVAMDTAAREEGYS